MAKRVKVGFGAAEGTGARRHAQKTGDFEGREYVLASNFGLQGGILFSSQEDYDRFEAYLYLLNAIESQRASNFFLNGRERDVFDAARGENLVAIGAYSFTPKAFFVLLTPLVPNGVAKFMQKLQTAYTMYFNLKYQRSGRIFQSAYHSEHARNDAHLKYLFSRTHMHPAILFDPLWEDEIAGSTLRSLAFNAAKYRYSSAGEYMEKKFRIIAPAHFPPYFLKAKNPDETLRFWKQNKKSEMSN